MKKNYANRHHDCLRHHDSLLCRAIRCCAFKVVTQVAHGFRWSASEAMSLANVKVRNFLKP